MVNQTKRGRPAESATCRSRTDASDARVESAASQPETARSVPAARTAQAVRSPSSEKKRRPKSALSRREDSGTGGADFRHALLSQADLAAENLSHALFNHANLAGANLTKANLSGATLRFATAAVADLEAADMSGADLRLACFNQANLSAASLSGALLDHADFSGANLAKANLSSASLRFATLKAAKLEAADVSCADLRHARLDGADLSAANLNGALLDYADFSGANLANTNLRGARLRYAKNLTRAQLGQGRVSDSTILPFHFQEAVGRPWTRGRSDTAKNRPIWIAGLLIGTLASIGLVWPLLGSRLGTPSETPLVVAAVTPVASRSAILPPPESLAQTAAPRPDVATLPVTSLTSKVFAPDLRAEVSEASQLMAAASPGFAPPHPTAVAPNLLAVTSETLSIVAGTPPPGTARGGGVTKVLTQVPTSVLEIVPAAKVLPPRLALSTLETSVLNDALPPLVAAIPATLAVAVRELATEEHERELGGRPAKNAIAASPSVPPPLTLVISLNQQKIDVYRGTGLLMSSKVSSGKRGYDTKAGVFSILEKQRHHHSNLYSGAPMPWMQRLTWTGTALHGGVLPGYPASHGCVRLPFSFAPKLFQMTTPGENVVVTGNRVAPKLIEHENLFQPVPAPVQAALVLAEQDPFAIGILPTAASENPDQATTKVEPALDDPAAAPLRILVTRRTQLDRIIGTQYLLASLGYLRPQNFSGRLGKETLTAIKAFQKANGLRETGAFSDDLAKKIHEVAGKAEPPEGHLFVRQDFRRVFDVPIAFRNPEQTLGTHIFTAMGFAPGSAKAEWMALSLEGGDSASVLDRVEIPDDVRRTISERLTPGSSLIVADTSVNSAILPEGDDFLVLAKVTPATALPRRGRVMQSRRRPRRLKSNRPRPYRL
jgi:uncharacterized protein YjbI with pentapeptide repeats/lipoprotein-anchoring transpeptidase ErfK/SrfK